MVITRQQHEAVATMCRSHGLRLSGSWLLSTLVLGWWGVISFFVNCGCVLTDLSALLAFARVGSPGEVADDWVPGSAPAVEPAVFSEHFCRECAEPLPIGVNVCVRCGATYGPAT